MIIVKLIRNLLIFPIFLLMEIAKIYNHILSKLDTRNHNTFFEEYLQKIIDNKISKKIYLTEKKFIKLHTPTKISSFRAKSFFSKEPETLKWMSDNGKQNKVLFDIGANVGLYSLYYAKKFNGKVYAFEPSIRNLDLLTQNIKLNDLNNKISVFSNPLTNKNKIGKFFQHDLTAGMAGATFDSNFKKKKIEGSNFKEKKTSSFSTYGLTLDNLFNNKILPLPDLIKIDVDGNEFEILQGCRKILSQRKKLHILIEIRKNTSKKVNNLLRKYNFKFISKKSSNYIWQK